MGPLINNMANIEHPGGFFGLTEFGTDTFFKDQALNIFNHTLTMDQWYDAFMKLTPEGNGKLNRAYLQDVVTELYWGRVPSAEELDTFMLHFNGQNPEPIEWPEFIDGLKKFRADPRPGVCDPSFCDYKSAGTLKDDEGSQTDRCWPQTDLRQAGVGEPGVRLFAGGSECDEWRS